MEDHQYKEILKNHINEVMATVSMFFNMRDELKNKKTLTEEEASTINDIYYSISILAQSNQPLFEAGRALFPEQKTCFDDLELFLKSYFDQKNDKVN